MCFSSRKEPSLCRIGRTLDRAVSSVTVTGNHTAEAVKALLHENSVLYPILLRTNSLSIFRVATLRLVLRYSQSLAAIMGMVRLLTTTAQQILWANSQRRISGIYFGQRYYDLGQNRVEAYVNDTLHRSAASGGLAEIAPDKVALTQPEMPVLKLQ